MSSSTATCTKAGTHTLVPGGNNSFEGALSINEGVLSVNSPINLGKALVVINFAGPGTLAATAKMDNPRQVQLASGATGTFDIAAGTLRLAGAGCISDNSDVAIATVTYSI